MCRHTRKKISSKMEFSTLNFLGNLGVPDHKTSSSNDHNNVIWNIDSDSGNHCESIFQDWLHDVVVEEEILKPFHELDEIQEVWTPNSATTTNAKDDFNLGETQNLIDEVEEFLSFHENNNNNKNNNISVPLEISMDMDMEQLLMDTSTSTQRLEKETKVAEDVLDSLIRGTIKMDNNTPKESSTLKGSSLIDTSNVTNVSEFVLEDGRNVIIMIAAPASPVVNESSSPALPSSNDDIRGSVRNPISPTNASSDTEWTPSPAYLRKRVYNKKKSANNVKKPRSSKYSILDKKERKKWQNVEAARRYRDKKKVEQVESELEIKMLEDKNKALKDHLNNMSNEVSTLKKLMTELGIIHHSSS